jgi:hypothetical protein
MARIVSEIILTSSGYPFHPSSRAAGYSRMLFYKNKHIHRLIDLAGEIYNHCIALHKRYYRMTGKHLNVFMLRKQYYETQASEEIPALEKPRFPGRSGRRHQD